MSELLLRRKEICDLRLSDWDPAARKIVIRQSKTDQAGRGASYILRPGTADLIETWLMAAGLSEVDTALQADRIPLFPGLLKNGALRLDALGQIRPLEGRSVCRILSQRGAAAGIAGVSGHTLRRSVARILHEAGCSDKKIQNAGRWETVDVMRTYVGLHREHTSAGHLLDALTPST
jgi:integrase